MPNATAGTLKDRTLSSLQVIGNTPSINPQTGSLTVRGGVGISENLNVSGNAIINGNLQIPGNVEVGLLSIGGQPRPGYVLTSIDTTGNSRWLENWISVTGTIFSNQNICIGTTNSMELFTVYGNMFFDGLLKVPETLDIMGNISITGTIKDNFGSYILPGVTDILVGISATQNISNKTLISPIINGNMNFASSGKIINLNTPTNENDAVNKAYVDNLVNGLDWQDSVLNNTIQIPPNTPTIGDRYIIPIGSTGAWSSKINNITEWNGSSWIFIVPNNGFASLVESDNKQYTFNGSSWVLFGAVVDHSSLSELLDDDHTQYAHLPGRTGGQQFYGGTGSSNNLIIESTSHSVKGSVAFQPNGGNVGIGITTSVHQLHIVDNQVRNLQFVVEQNNLSGQAGIRLHHTIDTSGNGLQIQHTAIGNVNISQTSSNGNVYFYNKGSQSDYVFYNTNSDLERFSILTDGTIVINKNLNFRDGFNEIIYTDDLIFKTNSTNIFVLGSTGNIGIGITTPTAKLNISGGGIHLNTNFGNNTNRPELTTSATITPYEIRAIGGPNNPNANDGFLRIRAGGGSDQQTSSFIDLSGFSNIPDMNGNIVFGVNGLQRMRINSNGNVGIGVTSPQDKLDINGNIKISGTINQGSNIFSLPSTTDTLIGRNTIDIITNKSFQDTSVVFINQIDNTKTLEFDLNNADTNSKLTLNCIQTSNRIITFPDISDTLVTLTANQVLANKTLSSPVISSIVNTGTLTMPTTTDTLVGRTTIDTLTNKTLVSPSITGNMSMANNTYLSTDQIRARDADGLLLTDDGNLGIFIQDGGNVGIGVSSPISKLDVDGDVKVNDYDLFIQKSTSRVGINTSLPSTDLDINGSVYIANNLIINGDMTINGTISNINTENVVISDPLVKYADKNIADTLDIGFFGMYIDGGITKYSGLFRDVSSGSKPYRLFKDLQELPLLTVNTNGIGYDKGDLYLGDLEADFITIGTFSDSYPLFVNKTVSNNWSQRINNNETTVYIGHSNGMGINISTGTVSDNTYIAKFGNNNISEIFRVQNNGLVGIRTSNAGEILDVFCSGVGEGARIGNSKIGVWEGNVNYTAFTHDVVHSNASSYAIKQMNTGETFINTASTKTLHFRNNDIDYMVMDASGNIGIGTLTPQRKLHVEGGTLVTVDLDVYGNLNILGQINAISAETIEVFDPMFKLASGNTLDIMDTGFYMQYGISNGATAGIRYAGIIRDNNDGEFKIFNNLNIEPGSTQVNTVDPSFQYATFGVGKLNVVAGTTECYLNMKYTDNGSGYINFIEDGVSRNVIWATNDKLYFDTGGEIIYRRISDQVELFSVDQSGLNVSGTFSADGLGITTQLNSYNNTFLYGPLYASNSCFINNLSVTGSLNINNGGIFSLANNSGNSTFKIVTNSTNGYDTMIVNNNQTSNNTGFSCGTVRTDGIALQVVNGVALTNGLPTTNGTQLMVVVGSGNVGIGTNNPTEKLHVVGTIGVFGPENNQAGYITTTGESTINNKINIVANRGSGGIVFSTNNGGIAEQLRITTTGNLGIGTNSPDNKIHLYTSTAQSNIDINDYLPTSFSQDIIIERQQSSVTDGIYGKQGPSIDFRATDATDKWSCGSIVGLVDPFGGSSYDGGLAFYTSPGGTVNHNDSRTKGGLLIPALTLGHDQRAYFTGNVGIGSTNPGNKLDVNGKIQTTNFAMTSGAQNGYVLTSDGSGNASWSSISSDTTLISDTDGDTRITVEAVVDEDRIRFVTNGTERMLIGSTGNIGIGITNPSTKLEINGNCTATQFITLSDLNEKQNIKLLSSQKCIDTVKNINLYEFEYKNNQHSSIGVIAQEIEEMFPQAVVINENGTRYVNYQMLFILMFGCIKELIHLKN